MRVEAPARRPADRTGLVFNIMRFALHDGPGIRTTVFLKGCPLRCWWCHNPESQSAEPEIIYLEERCIRCGECVRACPEGALSLVELRDTAGASTAVGDAAAGDAVGEQAVAAANGGAGAAAGERGEAAVRREGGEPAYRLVHDAVLCQRCGACVQACPAGARQLAGRWMTVPEVVAEVVRDQVFFDESGGGVTISGGEPLTQPEFVEGLLAACRGRGLRTVLDTCGLAHRDVLERIRPYVDLFLYDLKVMDPAEHRRFTGVRNDLILRNLERLAEAGSAVVVRMPVIPGVNDGADNLDALAGFMVRLGLRDIDLLPYHRLGSDKYQRLHLAWRMEGIEPPDAGQVETLAARLRGGGLRVRIGG